MKFGPAATLFSAAALFLVPAAATSLTLGQTDTFQDGTVQGWTVGPAGAFHPAPPAVVPTGGPAGEGDAYLRLTSTPAQTGAGSRLAVINNQQWTGNYVQAGIKGISMDVKNFGTRALALRWVVADAEIVRGLAPPNHAISSAHVLVPPGGPWTTVSLSLDPADLTALSGDAAAALANAAEVRIVHSASATFPPLPIDAELGIDNVRAVDAGGSPAPGDGGALPPVGTDSGGGGGCFIRTLLSGR